MKTAGLVLDVYDDLTGEILKSVCPTAEELPEAVKTAHFMTPEERAVLRDEAYALILHNDGEQLRKFACVDEGNTILSTMYFIENFDKLPPEAAKTAAINLKAFNEEFGLPVPDTIKLAAVTGMARKRDSYKQPVVGDEADWAQRTNLVSVRGGGDSGRVGTTVNQLKIASFEPDVALDTWVGNKGPQRLAKGIGKLGLVSGAAYLGAKKGISGKKEKKAAGLIPAAVGGALIHDALTDSVNHGGWRAIKGAAGAAMAARGISSAVRTGKHRADEEQKEREAFRKKVANVVDVSALEPDPVVINKKAKIAALGSQYSLDSYSDVKDAVQFFSENWTLMDPANRHEFSVKTASRAEELGIDIPELMARYGSTEYGPDVEAHLANRRSMAPQFKVVWDDLQEKRAMIEPEQFAQLLKEADEFCNLQYEYGGAVFDPYYATFGGQGQEKLAWAWSNSDGDQLTEESLKAVPHEALEKTFSKDFVEAFSHDPITIFESMPDAHKALISKLVP